MFHSLYTRYKESLPTQTTAEEFVREWPASYLDGISNMAPEAWELRVGGDVATPKTFNIQELRKLPRLTQNRRLVSAEGWTYRAEWEGILLQPILEQVKPSPQATLLKQTNLMGHVEYLPLTAALQNRALLCYGESKKPLPSLYGGPVRLMVFDRYSYKGMQQITQLEFVSPETEAPGFWKEKGYSQDGQIQPGQYYAFDLKKTRPIHGAGEVTSY